MNGLDLFSGIGGGAYALRKYIRPLAFCEIDAYARAVLLSRMASGEIEPAPIWDDVRTLRGGTLPPLDIITGGFPCQDISVAGHGAGLEGSRSGLFFEVVRLIEEIQPTFVFLENVPAIRTRGAERVVKELSRCGYECRWTNLSAAEVGAHHKRDRWWLLAAHAERVHLRQQPRGLSGTDWQGAPFTRLNGTEESLANSKGDRRIEWGSESTGQQGRSGTSGSGSPLGDPHCAGLEVRQGERCDSCAQLTTTIGADWWATEPDVGRVAHGVPARVDRIRGLGNAWVPLQALEAFEELMGL